MKLQIKKWGWRDAAITGLVWLVGSVISSTVQADEVVLYDGKKVTGTIRSVDSQALKIEVGKDLQEISLFDVTSYKFLEPALPQNVSQLLIDGEKPSYAAGPRTAKVKLRKGLHRFTLPYYHSVGLAKLEIQVSGPGMKKAEVPKDQLFRVNAEVREIPSREYQVDEAGFRLPVKIEKPEKYIAYRLMEWSHPVEVKSVDDLKAVPVKRYGASPRLALLSRRSAINFGFVFEGLIQIPQDGEYEFAVETDKNSKAKLYIGAYPSELYKQAKSNKSFGWRATFSQSGSLTGTLKEWNDAGIHFQIPAAEKEIDLTLKPEAVHELWKIPEDTKQTKTVDRKGESKTEDSAYVTTQDGNVHRVSGEVVGMNEESLLFQYQGQQREVNLERVVGLVLQKNRVKPESKLALQSLMTLIGNTQIPGVVELNEGANASITMPWGDRFSINKDYLESVKTVNARSVSLVEIQPDSVKQVPFFNQQYPYQINKSLIGQPLKIGTQSFSKGICVHARTVLVYQLGKNFEKFQTTPGLQAETGALGNVAVKVMADQKILFENPEFTSATKTESLDLDVTGCETLTLVVDFGKNQDVGDRFVWGNPRLIRKSPKELAANQK
ncbi:NPCBM/NEW2 domain-containing protein [Gimesia sp.]|uniref:NPCBM/NEW2 domain-containing protein n=1 Tax=Gimesia sp. TaxID=2024833 RepID=UPI003A950287